MMDYSDFDNHYRGEYLKSPTANATSSLVPTSVLLVSFLVFAVAAALLMTSPGSAIIGRFRSETSSQIVPGRTSTTESTRGMRVTDVPRMSPPEVVRRVAPECRTQLQLSPCSSLTDPKRKWYYGNDGAGGRCLPWKGSAECLFQDGNGFNTLAECERICPGAETGKSIENSGRCGAVLSRPCKMADKVFRFTSIATKSGAQQTRSASPRMSCVLLPQNKCTTPEFGFTTRRKCRHACDPSKEGSKKDARCTATPVLHDCREDDHRLSHYYDVEGRQCLPWKDICVVNGFPDEQSCTSKCVL